MKSALKSAFYAERWNKSKKFLRSNLFSLLSKINKTDQNIAWKTCSVCMHVKDMLIYKAVWPKFIQPGLSRVLIQDNVFGTACALGNS